MNLNYRKRLHLLGTIAHCQYSAPESLLRNSIQNLVIE